MFCENCGNALSETAKFCSACGTKIEKTSAPAFALKKVETNPPQLEELDKEAFENTTGVPEEEVAVMVEEIRQSLKDDNETAMEEPKNEEAVQITSSEKKEQVPIMPEEIPTAGAIEEAYDNLDEEYDEPTEVKETPEEIMAKLSYQSHKVDGTISLDDDDEEEYINPVNDPYYDDVLPEIENEINQIPKDIIVKAIAVVAFLFLSIAWFIILAQ